MVFFSLSLTYAFYKHSDSFLRFNKAHPLDSVSMVGPETTQIGRAVFSTHRMRHVSGIRCSSDVDVDEGVRNSESLLGTFLAS